MKIQNLPLDALAAAISAELAEQGRARLLVVGHSMVPMLRSGRDRVILSPVDRPLKPGAIILFQRSAEQPVLHRIIRRKGDGFLCCGDHQHQLEWVAADRVLAVVSAFERAGKSCCVTQWSYRIYVAAMLAFFPLRRPYLYIRKSLGRLKRSLNAFLF